MFKVGDLVLSKIGEHVRVVRIIGIEKMISNYLVHDCYWVYFDSNGIEYSSILEHLKPLTKAQEYLYL